MYCGVLPRASTPWHWEQRWRHSFSPSERLGEQRVAAGERDGRGGDHSDGAGGVQAAAVGGQRMGGLLSTTDLGGGGLVARAHHQLVDVDVRRQRADPADALGDVARR